MAPHSSLSQNERRDARDERRIGAYLLTMASDDDVQETEDSMREDVGKVVSTRFSQLQETQRSDIIRRCFRLLFSSNVSKKPLKRADLRDYMFESIKGAVRCDGRMFDDALQLTQEKFRTTFGMQIKELAKPVKSKQGLHKKITDKSQPQCTKAYILVSTLPPKLRPEPPEDTLALFGFITTVASMILIEPGCILEDQALYHNLQRIGVYVREENGHRQLNNGNVKELLEKKLVEQWYFGRDSVDDKTFYTLGPRLRTEIDDDDLIAYVNSVFIAGNPRGGLDEGTVQLLQRRLKEANGSFGSSSK